jgi:hypothetical protein
MPRDEHGHFVRDEKSEPPPKSAPMGSLAPATPPAKGGWRYHGVIRDALSGIYMHRWTILDPTGAPLVFMTGVDDPKASEADAIKAHKARLAG